MSEHVAVIGAGIVGLANAWSAARRGHRVTVFERHARALGASIRNFGMIWPIGQPAGELHELALRSRAAWIEIAGEAGLWLNPCGSIHLAHRPDEWEVLREFHATASDAGFDCELLDPGQVQARTHAANPHGLLGGLYSSTELAVNPRTALPAIADWLARRLGVCFKWSTPVTRIVSGEVWTATADRYEASRIVICNGSEFEMLLPEIFRTLPLRRCKLQMMKTAPQPAGWRLGPHLAGGLTLRHYANFAACKSLVPLRERVAAETPELDSFGIHVMAAQNDAGEVILGDSHEHDDFEPFDKTVIDELMLRELHRIIRLPDWTTRERWHGIYAKHPREPIFTAMPLPKVHICTATGGAGMTMAFGLAERLWQTLE